MKKLLALAFLASLALADPILFEASRDNSRFAKGLKESISTGKPEKALEGLRKLSQLGPDERYFVVEGKAYSIDQQIDAYWKVLPKEEREAYQQALRDDSATLLEEAAKQNSDILRLQELVRKFPCTKAGEDGAVLLATVYLDRGDYFRANYLFQRIRARGTPMTIRTLFKAAIAQSQAESKDASADLRKELFERLKKEELNIGRKQYGRDQAEQELDRGRDKIKRTEIKQAEFEDIAAILAHPDQRWAEGAKRQLEGWGMLDFTKAPAIESGPHLAALTKFAPDLIYHRWTCVEADRPQIPHNILRYDAESVIPVYENGARDFLWNWKTGEKTEAPLPPTWGAYNQTFRTDWQVGLGLNSEKNSLTAYHRKNGKWESSDAPYTPEKYQLREAFYAPKDELFILIAHDRDGVGEVIALDKDLKKTVWKKSLSGYPKFIPPGTIRYGQAEGRTGFIAVKDGKEIGLLTGSDDKAFFHVDPTTRRAVKIQFEGRTPAEIYDLKKPEKPVATQSYPDLYAVNARYGKGLYMKLHETASLDMYLVDLTADPLNPTARKLPLPPSTNPIPINYAVAEEGRAVYYHWFGKNKDGENKMHLCRYALDNSLGKATAIVGEPAAADKKAEREVHKR